MADPWSIHPKIALASLALTAVAGRPLPLDEILGLTSMTEDEVHAIAAQAYPGLPAPLALQRACRDLYDVIALATETSGNVLRALNWFSNYPISAFDGQTAEQLVAKGRALDVCRLIESMASGVAG